ncbi:MAG TPA: FAD-linked oxidase C-terminal domain-containing protein [Thermoleophilaceae bacterium]|nr:FAD-linked oxidase C-terminal domain-containing protein [Thermoleophilaceae bacterium]
MGAGAGLAALLAEICGEAHVQAPPDRGLLSDATETRGLGGHAEAAVFPADAQEVARIVGLCCSHGVPLTPRGGGTGFAGGAVPRGGVVLSLERLRRVRSIDPLAWRMVVEAGLPTADVRRLARENGLLFPPDPGAAEQSQIGGNIATNAGGPHAFKYGVTGNWVTGLEVAVAPGELIRVGGPVRKDVSGLDLVSLLTGSEGTLGVITAAWLRLIPAPEAALPVMASYPDAAAGCSAVERVLACGVVPAALEFLDAHAAAAAGREGFLVIAEADGGAEEAARAKRELSAALAGGARSVESPHDAAAFWRWRDGVSIAVTARRGGKVSEDIAVPVERLLEAIEGTHAIAARHGLEACCFGHAGDGNVHSTFLVDRSAPDEVERASDAARELFSLARSLGGTVSGEHGIGLVKAGASGHAGRVAELQRALKAVFDPAGVLNPGKKEAG